MRKTTAVLAVPVLSVSLLVAGCGGSDKTATSTNTVASNASATDATTQCPADNTQSFAKTRFVTNVALGSGAFYQWIYKPFQAGKFKSGADGRTFALVKAGLAGAFAAKQLKDATNNVKADPTLCKVLITPLTALSAQMDGLKDKIRGGDLAAITGAAAGMGGLLSTAKQNGLNITPSEDVKL